jgi:predicted permease
MRWHQRLFRRARTEKQLDAELRFRLDQQITDYVATGMTPEEARSRARLEFGGLDQVKEECRDVGAARFIETLIQDLRYGLRQLRRYPGFTAVAVITLALGIGANTAIFSLIDAVLLKSLPVRDPQQLVLIWQKPAQPLSYPLYRYIRDHNRSLAGVVAFHAFANWNVSAGGKTQLMTGQLVSGNYFRVLGISPAAGRLLSPQDDEVPGRNPVAVISFNLWSRRFGLAQNAIGATITIYGQPFTIIGATPPEFFGTQAGLMPDVTIPLMMQRAVLPVGSFLNTSSDAKWLYVMGRLRRGASEQKARANLNVLFQQFMTARAGSYFASGERSELIQQGLELASGSQGLNRLCQQFSYPLRILMAVVGLILLIACANLASLLLARASARQSEFAIRLAIGAGRFRLTRQLLTESLCLAGLGTALGLAFAHYADAMLVTLLGIQVKVQSNPQVLGFCAVVCLLTAALFGLAPALRASRTDVTSSLKRTRCGTGSRRLRQWLLKAQVSFSLLLLVGAVLFVRSLRNLKALDPGFNRKNVLLVPIDPVFSGYTGQRIAELYKELLATVSGVPGVQSATLVTDLPVSGLSWFQEFVGTGSTIRPKQVAVNHVGAGFFETFGIPILKGRDFNAHDSESTPKVIAISEAVARQCFPHEDPIGRATQLGIIIAVVKDVRYGSLRETAPLVIYQPLLQEPSSWGAVTIAVRTYGRALRWAPLVPRAVHELDPTLQNLGVSTMAAKVNDTLRQEILFAALTSFLGSLALVLVSIGLYGSVAYTASRRVNEIGIRMALGARQANVLWLIMQGAFAPVASGLATGLRLRWRLLTGLRVCSSG